MNMEFLTVNEINTTTMITVSAGSTSTEYLFDRNSTKQFQSLATTTAVSITVSFLATTTIDRIVLQNINLKDFTIYYDGTVTNLFSLASNNITSTTDFSNNSATNLYLYLGTGIACTSVSIVASATVVAGEAKKIGEFWLGHQQLQLEKNPTAKDYKVKLARKEYQHKMSDGGIALYVLDEKFQADIRLSFQSENMKESLYDLYSDWSEFVFVPFPTGTSWDGNIFEVNWVGDFEFESYSDNYIENGFSGVIKLRETPR